MASLTSTHAGTDRARRRARRASTRSSWRRRARSARVGAALGGAWPKLLAIAIVLRRLAARRLVGLEARVRAPGPGAGLRDAVRQTCGDARRTRAATTLWRGDRASRSRS